MFSVVDCGDPGDLESFFDFDYGGYTGEETTEGSIFTFHCVGPEYILSGSDTITCTSDGTWSDDTPYCGKPLLALFLLFQK